MHSFIQATNLLPYNKNDRDPVISKQITNSNHYSKNLLNIIDNMTELKMENRPTIDEIIDDFKRI